MVASDDHGAAVGAAVHRLSPWAGRGPTDDDTLEAGKAIASAAMAVLTWGAQQSE